jgi:hypothetical protein
LVGPDKWPPSRTKGLRAAEKMIYSLVEVLPIYNGSPPQVVGQFQLWC